MSEAISSFDLHIEQINGYEFRVKFDKPQHPELIVDEPPPLGKDAGPNPARLLAAAVGDCLSASLLFCLSRSGMTVAGMKSEVHVELVRNEQRRLRIGKIDVKLKPRLPEQGAKLTQCLDSFEDFCIVTQSVRQGVAINVSVEAE